MTIMILFNNDLCMSCMYKNKILFISFHSDEGCVHNNTLNANGDCIISSLRNKRNLTMPVCKRAVLSAQGRTVV